MKLHELRSHIESRLLGQEHLSSSLVAPLANYYAGLAPEETPAGIFLALGPTGSGKTYTPTILAEGLHGDPKNLLRVDCAEFQHSHEIAKIIGSPPGYLGHRETHPLLSADAIKGVQSIRCNLSILVFDEIEKASDALWNLLLGILDKATLTLGDNRKVYFHDTIVFMTSNLGVAEINATGMGFEKREIKGKDEKASLAAAKKRFSPEFMNRIDCILYYQTLTKDTVKKILREFTAELNGKLKVLSASKNAQLSVVMMPEAEDWLIERGYSFEYNAREMRRTFNRHVKNPISEYIVACESKGSWGPMRVTVAGDGQGLDIHPMMSTDDNYLLDLTTTTLQAAKAGYIL